MTFEHKLLAAMLTTAAMAAPTAAWAAVDQTLVLEGPGSGAIGENQLSFTTSSGQTAKIEEDEDEGTFIITIPGNNRESGNLTYPGPDGMPRTVFVPAPRPGQVIRLNVGTGSVTTGPGVRGPSLGGPSSGIPNGLRSPTLMGTGNYTTFKVPRAGVGVSDIGNSSGESFIDRIGGRIDWVGWGGDVLVPAGNFVIGAGFHGGRGNNREAGQFAAGGSDSGVVFNGESMEFGTGLNVGDRGIDIDSLTEVDEESFYAKFGMPIPLGGRSSIMPYAKVSHTEIDLRQTSLFTSPGLPGDFSSTLDNRLKTRRTSVGIGGYYNSFLSESFAIGFNLEGSVNFNKRKLNSMQTIDLFETTDTVNIRKDRSDTSFGIRAEVSGTYYFTPNAGLNLFAGIQHDDDFGRIDNVLSGNQILDGETVDIGSGKSTQLMVGARIVVGFGGF